jgi:hypothetical protein
MKSIAKWIERWSLDAVVVALLWGMAMGIHHFAELLILALATWLTYVADRLRDAAPEQGILSTDRHLYYRDHYRRFVVLWFGGMVSVAILALVFLPGWKIGWGLIIVAGILLYLWGVRSVNDPGRRLLLKRTAVPLIFASGMCWMAEGWRSSGGIYMAILVYAGAMVNVLLISYWENRDKLMPKWLPHLLGASLVGMFCLGQFGLLYFLGEGIGGLVSVLGYFILLLSVQADKAANVRIWSDLILAAGAVAILVQSLASSV